MKWFMRQVKVKVVEQKQVPYRELRKEEIFRACGLGEEAPQSMLAVHLARTLRDAAVLEMRNVLRNVDLKAQPDVQHGMLALAAARMDAAIEFEEEWRKMFVDWQEEQERERGRVERDRK
jgi:uncharacterized protein with von Willebrand factor type A (vWA) domain